jgi:hypothetical protein
MPRDSGYLTGQSLLFDVVADMYEEYNVAAENPDVVARLMARLQRFSTSHCAGERCLPDQASSRRPEGRAGQRHQRSLRCAAMEGCVHAFLEAVEGQPVAGKV